jgi:transcriptional regulator with PAS, ATPase and Fis domain
VALAHSGTLFLDEVDALTPKAQVTLLRFLQHQQYRPIGARRDERADVRVIAASNDSLDDLVKAKRFRTDLLYRLKLMQLRLPPLRERTGGLEAPFAPLRPERRRAFRLPGAPPGSRDTCLVRGLRVAQ